MSCKKAMTAASVHDAMHINRWRAECNNAVADLIGYKSLGIVKAAQKAYNQSKTLANKRKLKMAQLQYKEHSELFDTLVGDMLQTGREINYSPEITTPTQMAKDWNLSFAKNLRGEINPITIRQGQRTAKATQKLVVRRIRQREKWLKSGKIPAIDIWGSPPEFVATKADKYGIIQDLVNKALRLSDRDISITSKYSTPISNARENFTNGWTSAIRSMGSRFNLNNVSIWGLSEENYVPFRLVNSDEDVVLVGETIINNVQHYKVKYSDGTIKNVPREEVNASDNDIERAIISLYRDELPNEILDGQTRLIVPSVIDKKIDTIEDEVGVKPITNISPKEKDSDYLFLKRKIYEMFKSKDSTVSEDEDSNGNRVAGIHTIVRTDGLKQFKYRYVMIKQGEGANIRTESGAASNVESYKAYLIDKVQLGDMGTPVEGTRLNYIGKTIKLIDGEVESTSQDYTQAEVDKVFGREEGQDGVYYRSTEINDFGRRIAPKTGKKYKKGDPIDGTHTKQYVNFEKIENQPPKELMESVWFLVSDIRKQLKLVYDDASYKARKIENERQKLQNKLISKYRRAGLSEEEISTKIKKIIDIGGVESRVWFDKNTGELRTSTTYAKMKKENYVPHLYSYPAIREQLMKQIEAIDTKLTEETKDENRIARLTEGKENLVSILASMGENRDGSAMVDMLANPYLKHITGWTNQVGRRKDAGIYKDYLNHMYRNIHRNQVIVETLKAISILEDVKTPGGTIEYLSNRIKLAMGDSDTRAMTFMGGETGYEQTAKWINSLPNWMRGGVTHDAQSAERITKWFTTPSTIRYLGAEPALGNQTQIVNEIIQVGFGTALDAYKLRQKFRTQMDKIVENTGVLNVLNQFSDIMNVDGDAKWNDFLFVPFFGSTPNPVQLKQFRDLLKAGKAGREKFVKEGADWADEFLIKMEMRQQGATRASIRELQELRKLKGKIDKAALAEKRGALFDFYGLTKDQSYEMVENRVRALMGNMTEAKIKKWVTWKLSWWFDEIGGPGKEIFTFTEGEKTLRSMTVLMALVDAQKRGILPGTMEDLQNGNFEDLNSKLAKKIGRDAVYNTQFGMTPMYLGEGFNGFGRLIFQYKQYPTLQSIYDWQTFKKFTDGNNSAADGMVRIANAIGSIVKQSVVQDKNKKYDPKAKNVDHEAIAMARFLFTRVMASAVGSLISVVPFMGRMLRNTGSTGFGMIRSAESPALGFAFRMGLWTSILAMNDDEEADGALGEIGNALKFLLLPVLLSYVLQLGVTGYELLTEDE